MLKYIDKVPENFYKKSRNSKPTIPLFSESAIPSFDIIKYKSDLQEEIET